MKKRSIALLLCAAILMSLFPVMSTLAYDNSPITVKASSTTLPENADRENGSVTLTAAPASESITATNYHWQIRIPAANLWVDITGASGATLDVTYAMVASALSGNSASLRAAATVSGETVYSDTVELTIGVPVEPETKPETAVAPKVLTQASATVNSGTAPTEAPAVDTAALEKAVTDAEANLKAAQDALTEAQAKVQPAKDAQTAAAQAVTDAETAVANAKAALEAPTEDANAEELQAAVAAAEANLAELNDKKPIADAAVVKAESDVKLAQDAVTDAETAVKDAKAALEEAQAAAQAPAVASTFAARARSATFLADNDTSDTPSTTYSVVINYVFENKEVVSDPYTASLAAGSNFSATVNHPTVQGYLPYVGEATETSPSIELNITGIQADVTYTVTYKPTNVNYTVIHYQQNVDNDNYIEVERETKQGLTNSTVPEVANTYDGFYALLYEKPAIAADDSTKVEVYYDRYYYLMNFDLDGGYGVEPIYARYGATIGNVGTPIKAGYTFDGWSLNGTKVESLPTTMPAANQTYKAIWKADDSAKVTVVFWGENANDEEYSYLKSTELNTTPGSQFTYSESGSLICGQTEHVHDATCGYACGETEHTHDDSCYQLTCTQEVHTHSATCYTCGQENHTHDTGCYAGVGAQFESTAREQWVEGEQTNGAIGESWVWYLIGSSATGNKYIYINGTWYKYSGNLPVGSVATTTCGKTEGTHTHTDACLGCGKTEHTHSDYTGDCYTLICTTPEHTHSGACGYNCGKTAHTHTSNCYMSGAGLDSNLWKFVKSDTVTVAADGSSIVNVYYDRTEKTLTFKYNYSRNKGNYQSTETITAKWGSDISTQFKAICNNANSTFWTLDQGGDGPFTNYIGVMPQSSATYYHRSDNGSNGTMTYWGQDLDGNYTVKLFEVGNVGGYRVTDEDRYEFEGFTYSHGTSNGSSCPGATFYYNRNSYNLTFSNGYAEVKQELVKYQAPLSTYADFVPNVPSAYEPGSVVFGGWYLNPECTGAEYKLSEHTMPAENVLLYAKWVPVTHKVEFYLDKDAMTAGTKIGDTHPDLTVPHGSKVETVPADPANGSYAFVGWFYMENGVEKAFDFANMPVNKDLKVYGKWSSNTLMEYTIYYKIQGKDTEVAAPTTGSGLAGITKTFDAKGGTDLYAAYQEGYFPVVKSHSLTIDIENEANNTFTFWYVQKEAVPYTVKYLNKETGEPVATEKTVSDNRKAVVTETFVPVSGMMPDAYQKRLVVSAEEGAVNEIIFYYTEDTTHAYYKITHFTQNTDGENWTEYASSQAVGDIGKTYSADPMTIPGFTFDKTVKDTVQSGELTANGLELKLYYVRNSYPYEVRYLEQGTGKQLATPKTGSDLYGKVISESAIGITGYAPIAPTSQTLTIKIEEGEEAKLNIITFYYKVSKTSLTITKSLASGTGTYDGSDKFIFDVYLVKNDSATRVCSVTLAAGETKKIDNVLVGDTYKVVERTGWSSRYDCVSSNSVTKELTADANSNNFSFENQLRTSKWLTASATVKNSFGAIPSTDTEG